LKVFEEYLSGKERVLIKLTFN